MEDLLQVEKSPCHPICTTTKRRKGSYKICISGGWSHVPSNKNGVKLTLQLPSHVIRERIGYGEEKVRTYFTSGLILERRRGHGCYRLDDSSMSTASSSFFSIASQWLRTCLAEHHKCTKFTENDHRPPTRVVCVGPIAGHTDSWLYLAQPADRNMKYLTLSHCWGSKNVTKLNTSNFDSFVKSISVDSLPQTFRDAITITHNLGYKYLWIDALCIIQDSPENWATESATMGSVYSNSVLTIAALWGANSDSGCFVQRKPLKMQDCKIGSDMDENIYAKTWNRQRGQSLKDLAPSPLHSRAWVLQERLLSPRVLYYGPFELHWKCQCLEDNESHDGQHRNQPRGSLLDCYNALLEAKKSGIDLLSGKDELILFYNHWTNIMSIFWILKLTYHGDVLAALAGIAKRHELLTGMTFIFGMWKELLPIELLWYVRDYCPAKRHTAFPSWSWANIERGEIARSIGPKFLERVSRLGVDPVSISGRTITLNGPLLHVILHHREHGVFASRFGKRLVNYECMPDVPLPSACEVSLVPIIQLKRIASDYLGDEQGASRGLMLKTTGDGDNDYERVGYWTSHHDSKNELWTPQQNEYTEIKIT